MTKVISFVTKGHLPDVVRYVKRVKTYFGLFHKVEYTVDYTQSRFFDNEEEMAKFQKWREEYEEKERLEKEEKAKKKVGAA